jgi:hypothetical protein
VLGGVTVRSMDDLSLLHRFRLDSCVHCIVPTERFIIVGLENGNAIVVNTSDM